MAYSIGEDIGPYRIVEHVDSGGMATIYKAYQARLDRYVALKVLHQAYAQDTNFLARFEREAQIVARLDHPNIVPVYDYDIHDGRSFLVMKYIEGTTLKDLLRKGSLTQEEIVRLMTRIADALTYAHSQGILHRDIKPSNILLDHRNEPYLTDFGLARIVRTGQSTMSAEVMLGTPHYISPEQAQGNYDLDARADVYSLGVVLYELVTEQVPFNDRTSLDIIHHHIYTPPPEPRSINPKITPEVEKVLLKALAKKPTDRYESPHAMMAAFNQAVGSPEIAKERQTPPHLSASPLPSPTPRRPAQAGSTGTLEHTMWERKAGTESWSIHLKPFHWRPGAEWRTAPDGSQGFYTDEDIANMESKMSTEERIRWRVEQKIKARTEYITAMTVMSLVIVMMWVIWAVATPGVFMWPLIAMFGLLIGMVAVSIDYYSKHGPGAAKREEQIQREVERELERQRLYDDGYYDKLKNEDVLDNEFHMDEDGEISDSFVQSWEEQQRRKRQ